MLITTTSMADQHQIYKLFDVDKRGPQRQGMVTINKSDTVGDLQHKIQAFPRYKDVDPSDLKLFQVDVLDTEDLEQELAKKITALGRPLRPTRLKIPYILSCAWNPSRVQVNGVCSIPFLVSTSLDPPLTQERGSARILHLPKIRKRTEGRTWQTWPKPTFPHRPAP